MMKLSIHLEISPEQIYAIGSVLPSLIPLVQALADLFK